MIRQSGILFDQSRSLAPQISGSIKIRAKKKQSSEQRTSPVASRRARAESLGRTWDKRSRKVDDLDGNSGVGQASEFPFKSWSTRVRVISLQLTFIFFKVLLSIVTFVLRGVIRIGTDVLVQIGDFTLSLLTHVYEKISSLLQRQRHALVSGRKQLPMAAKTIGEFTKVLQRPVRLFPRLGTLLMVIAATGFVFTYGPLIQVELGYRLSRAVEPVPVVVESDQEAISEIPKGGFATLVDEKLIGEIPGVPDPAFSLIIPKIHAKSKIIANVNAADETSYLELLKTGVAHAAGTGLPGTDQTIYLFAHSTESPLNVVRYNAVFYLLRELESGDEVQIYYQGVKHRYFVSSKVIVDPTDTSYLAPVNTDQKERLILQTCWPPGTSLKRLLIFAEKKTLDTL